jgi:hypothetical protein
MSEDKILNGVNVTTVENAVKAIEEQPGLAKFKFRLHNVMNPPFSPAKTSAQILWSIS